MTFLELCQRLREESGGALTGPASVSGQMGEMARLVEWVRTAWQEIQTERRWLFDWAQGSVTLNASDTEYDPPEDFDVWEADTLRFGGQKIRVLPWGEMKSADLFTAAALAPNGRVHLNAAPETSGPLTFEYWRSPQDLKVDGDSPRMPERFHMAIVYRAQRQYGYFEGAPEVVQSAAINEARIMQSLLQSQMPTVEAGRPLA